MRPTEAAWLAGLIDGEGSFRYQRPSPRTLRRQSVLFIEMTDLPTMRRVSDLIGMNIYKRKPQKLNWKPCYQGVLGGQRLLRLLWEIKPYLVTKACHAWLLLEANVQTKRTLPKDRRHGLSPNEAALREGFAAALRYLNQKGPVLDYA
jgi:hypothetical protein